MIQTAKKLSKIKNKAVVLTGSMRPEMFSNSDASINLGIAIGAIQCIPNGVYIAMNGLIISWNESIRDKETDKFTSK